MTSDVVALASRLIAIDTAGANERQALDVIAPLLESAGFSLEIVPWQPERDNLVATWNGGGPFVLSGHLDTVPFEAARWQESPLGAGRDGDRLFGRGSSDMKGGVAAIVIAAISAATPGTRGFTLVFTAGEETGCHGALAVRQSGLVDPAALFIVGESTGNGVRLGHKGATWLEVGAHGRAAHGSRPELGVNAIDALADAIVGLRDLSTATDHPQLGRRSVSVGTIAGGAQTNLVPDQARMTVDIRTVPGADAGDVEAILGGLDVQTILTLPAVWSSSGTSTTSAILDAVSGVTGLRDAPAAVSYFTDAAVLDASLSRSYIIGPGDPDQPHTTNESVSVAALELSIDIYRSLLDGWERQLFDG